MQVIRSGLKLKQTLFWVPCFFIRTQTKTRKHTYIQTKFTERLNVRFYLEYVMMGVLLQIQIKRFQIYDP